jgi:enamine deaminase RidA (YjgF/YER057c/UK114 family)
LYEAFVLAGDLLALSAISSARGGQLITGKVGADVDLARAQDAARRAADNLLAILRDALEVSETSLERILLVRGYVNSVEGYSSVHIVIDAASERITECLGDKGRHARTVIGCATLPNNNAVTLEAIAVVRTAA